MLNINEIYKQALKDSLAIKIPKPFGYSVINYGVKIQKFESKTEILNMIESNIRNESNTRKNDKHIQKLKTIRENLLVSYSKRKQQLNKIR